MRLALYQSNVTGFSFCVVTRDDDDVKHIETTCNLPHGCKFVKWMSTARTESDE